MIVVFYVYSKAAEQRRTQKPPNTLFNTAPKPTTAAVRAAATQRLTAGSSQTQNIQGNIVSISTKVNNLQKQKIYTNFLKTQYFGHFQKT